jgi:hypothetical protein
MAEIETLAALLGEHYEAMPDPVKAGAIELGHSLGRLRAKLAKPETEQRNKLVDNEGVVA